MSAVCSVTAFGSPHFSNCVLATRFEFKCPRLAVYVTQSVDPSLQSQVVRRAQLHHWLQFKMVSMCPYKWALYLAALWAALYVAIEAAIAWRDANRPSSSKALWRKQEALKKPCRPESDESEPCEDEVCTSDECFD